MGSRRAVRGDCGAGGDVLAPRGDGAPRILRARCGSDRRVADPAAGAASQPAAPARERNPLSSVAIVQGFNAVRPRLADCYRRFQVPGIAMANVVIARSGRVSKADVTGTFAGTPTGACVEEAARMARFPSSDGLSTPYPFYVR
jgi:hypothetical protein